MNQKEIEKKLSALKKALGKHKQIGTPPRYVEAIQFKILDFHEVAEAFADLEYEIAKESEGE